MKYGKPVLVLSLLLTFVCHAQNIYYVSAVNGDDSNNGAELSPFKTIQKAADVMLSGDTCLIKQGVYRESVTPPTNGVTFKNYQDDYVLVTGLDVIQDWSKHGNGIHKASIADKVTDVFVGGKLMNWARHPNEADGNRLSKRDMMTVQMVPIQKASLTGTAILHDMEDKPDDFWKGGYVLGVSDDIPWWSSLHGKIDSSTGNELTCSEVCFLWWQSANSFGKGYGTGYVIGAFGALDSAGEWVWKDGELFFQPEPTQKMDETLVEGRTRVFAFNLTDKDQITIDGLHIKAANIVLPDSTNCVIKNCNIKYPGSFSTHFNSNYDTKQFAAWGDFTYSGAGVSIGGTNNTVENCYVGHTWTTGISLYGNSNTAQNNIVEEANWMGERMSLISNIGDDNKVLNNTLRRCARDGIEMGHAEFTQHVKEGTGDGYAKRATIKNNTIIDVAYFCPDSGHLYVNHSAGYYPQEDGTVAFPLANSEIAYNIMGRYHSPVYYSGHGGIYLDNGSSGYTVHHNVIFDSVTGININNIKVKHRPNHDFVYNNTFVNIKEPVRLNTQANAEANEENQLATQVVVKNNLATHENAHFTGTELKKNLKINVSKLVDADAFDFQLKEGASAIDAGVEVPTDQWPEGYTPVSGITDGYLGAAPDVGAFEYGAEPWTAGASIDMPIFVDELGFIDELIDGRPLVQSEIDAQIALEEAAKAKVHEQRWQSDNEENWLLTDFTAYSQSTKGSLYPAGGIAYRKILDVTPGVLHKATFKYTFSNKSGKTGAGVRMCIHEGDSPDADSPSLGYREFSTSADVSEPEDGTGSFEFTPTTDTVYVIFYKIGHSYDTAKAKVGTLDIEMVEQAPVLNRQGDIPKTATFSRAGSANEDTEYVSTIHGVTMTLIPQSPAAAGKIGVKNAHLGVAGGKNDHTVDKQEKLLISFDQPILLQTVDVGSIIDGESVYLTSPDFNGLTGVSGVAGYDDDLNRISQTFADFVNLDDDNSYQGILLSANTPIEMTVDDDDSASVSYNSITVNSLKIASASINESASIGTLVTTITATDSNAGDKLSYAITAGNTNNVFAIDGYSGEITVNSVLDYDLLKHYELTVTVTDDSDLPLSDSGIVIVDVKDSETPAIGLEVSLTSDILAWSVEEERDVKEYQIYVDNVLFDVVQADGSTFYSVKDVSIEGAVELVVVDLSGHTKSHVPADGNISTEVYDLKVGWNLIAVTSESADLDTLERETVGRLWGWDNFSYKIMTNPKPTDAIWAYSKESKKVYVVGLKSKEAITLESGWNMVGPTVTCEIPDDAEAVYSWDETYQIIEKAEELQQGEGYWLFSL